MADSETTNGPTAGRRSAGARTSRMRLPRTWTELSFANQLMLVLVSTSVGALLLAGVLISANEVSTTRREIVRDLRALGDVVAANCTAALTFQDPETANTTLAALSARPEIARAALVTSEGSVLSAWQRPGEREMAPDARARKTGTTRDGSRLVIVCPIASRGEHVGDLWLECTMDTLRSRVRNVVASVLVLVLLAGVFAYGVSLRMQRVVSEPIRRLSRAAEQVARSRDYSVRVAWSTRDELGVLTESFNTMMAQIEAQEQALVTSHAMLRQAQKMEAVGQLAGGVAHDFNNLLTAINGYATLLERRTAEDDDRMRAIREIRKAGERAANLVRQLLAFGRKQTLEPRILNLREVLADVEDMLGQLIPSSIRLVWSSAADVPRVEADPGQIQQAVVNLVVNARDAMPAGGTITVDVTGRELSELEALRLPGAPQQRYVVLTVSDTGVGIPAEAQAHIFEPFFTTKGVGKGTGLGLATVYGIVRQSNGHVLFDSEPGVGTTFRIYLPAVASESAADAAPEAGAAPGGSETVMVVDDEPVLLGLACDILETLGYTVLACPGPEDALAREAAHAGDIALLLTDFTMPGMNGRELSRRITQRRPGMRTLIMSGYADGSLDLSGESAGVAFLAKPFMPDTLADSVRAALDGTRAGRAA